MKISDITFNKKSLNLKTIQNASISDKKLDINGLLTGYYEIISEQSSGFGSIAFDEFLLSNDSWTDENSKIKLPTSWDMLKNIVNTFSKEYIENEISHLKSMPLKANAIFGKPGFNIENLPVHLKSLLTKMKHNPDDIFLRVGFGSGWKSMTGGVMSDLKHK